MLGHKYFYFSKIIFAIYAKKALQQIYAFGIDA